jgi:hypothetical protein
MTFFQRRRLADLAIAHRLPMMGGLAAKALGITLPQSISERADDEIK